MNESTDIKSRPGGDQPKSRPSIAAEAPEEAPRTTTSPAVKPLHSLALQVPLLLVVVLSLVISAGTWGLRTIVLRSFERLEVANAELDLRRFANALDYEVRSLRMELAHAMQHGGMAAEGTSLYVLPRIADEANFKAPYLSCLFDGQGRPITRDMGEHASGALQRLRPADFCRQASSQDFMEQVYAGIESAGLYHHGETFFVVAASRLPAVPPLGDAGAVLLLAHHLSTEEIDALSQRMAINIDFWSMDTPNLDVLEAAAGVALTLGAPIIVNKQSDDVLQVYWAFQDVNGEPAFLARANVFRDLREIADETVLLSAVSMGGVGIATILLSLVLVRALMVKRLSRLTGQLLNIRRGGLGRQRLGVGRGIFGQQDEITVLAEEFDTLLSELAATTQQLADVSYRAGRAEVTEGSLHNIGNALNSLLASADAALAKLHGDPTGNIVRAADELSRSKTLSEREQKLAQYAALAATEAGRQLEALKADISRVMVHVSHIEDILESQRRLGSNKDLAEPTTLLPLVQRAIAELADSSLRRINLQLDESLSAQPAVVCVRAITRQVLSNLLTNAAEAIARATPADGWIRLSATSLDVDGVRMVELCVTDNGIGLAAEEMAKLFQRHFTTKQGRGHGIGLHWSANVVASMGGQLYARSPGRGEGAAFYMRLPAA